MDQRANEYPWKNYLRRFSARAGRLGARGLAGLLLLAITNHPLLAQQQSPAPSPGVNAGLVTRPQPQTPKLWKY